VIPDPLSLIDQAAAEAVATIGAAVGVSYTQAYRDEAEIVATGTGVPVPERTTGLDGKSYPARREPQPASGQLTSPDAAATVATKTAALPKAIPGIAGERHVQSPEQGGTT
jgi:hypothetical protein